MKKVSTLFLHLLAVCGYVCAQPVISTMTPMQGFPGSVVTITGANFNATPANNIVYFGATRATVTAASATSLTTTVPVGATRKEVSVNNTATALTGYSQYPFLPTFDNSPYVPGMLNFDSGVYFATEINSYEVTVGDLDGDGKSDMIVPNYSDSTISIYRNINVGGSITAASFATPVKFATIGRPQKVSIGDIDGDGKPDLVVTCNLSNTVSIFRNTCTPGSINAGSFAPEVFFASGFGPSGIAIGDIDGDGKADIAVTNFGSFTISVFRNTSTVGTITSSSLASQVTFPTEEFPLEIAMGDIDGNGKPDLVVSCNEFNSISVFENTSTTGTINSGSFAPKVNFVTDRPSDVALGDIDGDGKPEVVLTNYSTNSVSVLHNTSTIGSINAGSFSAPATFSTGNWPISVAIGDLDGDGKADLAIANLHSGSVSLLRNTSIPGSITSGTFASHVTFATGGGPFDLSIGDLDGNGKPELAVLNAGGHTIFVLTNNPLSFISGAAAICTGANATLTNATPGGTWSSSAPGIASIGSVTGIITGIAPGTATISYNVAGGSAIEIITVNPLPAVGIAGAGSVLCEGGEVKLAGTGAESYDWLGDVIDGGLFAPPVGISTYTVIGTTGSCTAAATASITVNPLPSVGVTGSGVTICEGATATLYGTGATSYSWSGGIVDGVPFKPALGTKTYTVTGTTAGCSSTAVATVTVVPMLVLTSTAGPGGAILPAGTVNVCPGSVQIYKITPDSGFHIVDVTVDGSSVGAVSSYTLTATAAHTVHATFLTNCSEVPKITGTLTICTGSATALSNIIPGGTWSSSNADIAAVDPVTGLVTGVKAGTAIITYSPCPEFFTTVIVTIKPIPAPTAIVGPLAVCEGATVGLTNLMGTGTWSSSNPSVATIGMTSGIVTGITPGTVFITYTQYTGCYTTRIETVNMMPAPVTGVGVVCAGSAVSLSTTSTGGVWVSSHPAIAIVDSATGKVTGVVGGLAVIRYMMPTGCNSSMTVTVNNLPAGISGTLVLCEGGTVTLISKTAGGTWSSSDEKIATIGSATGILLGKGPGTVVISYTNASGCSRTAVVTVNSVPPAILGSASLCLGGSSALSNAATGGTWSSNNTAKATVGLTTGIVTAVSAGTAVITYRVPGSGCFTTLEVTVNGAPETISGAASVCIGSATTLSHPEDGGTWSSNDTAKATVNKTTGEVTGMSVGTVHITYHVSPGCYKTIVVNVLPLPVLTTTGLVCEGATTAIGFYPTGGTWVSSSTAHATVGATGIVSGVLAGTTTISYTKSPGCTSTRVVTVMPMPTAFTGSAAVCVGNTETLMSTPAGGTWTCSSLAKATIGFYTGVLTGISAGNATITYTAAGCRRTAVVTVGAMPAAISGSPIVCLGNTTTLTSATTGGAWSSSDTTKATVSAAGVVTGITPGTTTITYLKNGCARTVTVSVNAALEAISGGDQYVCVGGQFLYSHSVYGGTWSSSAPAIVSVPSFGMGITGVGTGTATITYHASPGCIATKQVTVNSALPPITGPANVCEGATIGLSIAATGGAWGSSNPLRASVNMGTGIVTGVSTGIPATITYMQTFGCFSTHLITVYSTPAPITGTAMVCQGSATALSCVTGGGSWSSSSYATATVSTAGHVAGVSPGTATITYTRSYCSSTREVTVNPLPSAIVGTAPICAGQSYTFTSAPAGGTWASSTPSIAHVVPSTGLVTGLINGASTLSYTLPTGCRRTQAIAVNPMPNAITGPSSVFVGSSITLASSTAGGTWSSSDAGIASLGTAAGIVTGVSAGTATITYQLTSTGCYATRVVTVNYLSSSRPAMANGTENEAMVNVFPNPSTGTLNITSNVNGVFSVYSLDSRQVGQYDINSATTTLVSLPYNLAAGAYMCRFQGEDGSVNVIRVIYQP